MAHLSEEPFRVLVVEDNPTFQQQITGALVQVGAGEVSAFATGTEALAFLEAPHEPLGLALIDIGLPDMSGIEVIREIRTRCADLPILVISVIKSEEVLLDAIRAGAQGYILKSESEEAIAHAICEVRQGNYPISPALARSLFKLAAVPAAPVQVEVGAGLGAGIPPPPAPQADAGEAFQLTPREREVLQLIAQGLSYQEVAEELAVSLSTIQTYVRGLYRKLEVHNRQAAVNKGREAGVL